MDIFKSNGDLFTSLADGTTSTLGEAPVILAGRNFAGYGKVLNENQLHITENFASATPPVQSVVGQLWYNTSANKIYVYKSNTAGYVPLSIQVSSPTAPVNVDLGDTWFDTTTDQFKIYAGGGWKTVGPMYNKSMGPTGGLPAIIKDTNDLDHIVVEVRLGNDLFAIVADANFTPKVPILGFEDIKIGFNTNRLQTQFKWHGTAANADLLNGATAATFLRKDQDATITGNVSINGVTTVKSSLQFDVQPTTNNALITSTAAGGKLELHVKKADGNTFRSIQIDGTTGEAQVTQDPVTGAGIASKRYVDEKTIDLSSWVEESLLENLNEVRTINTDLLARMVAAENTIGSHTINLTSVNTILDSKADINAPAFQGVPTAANPVAASNNNDIATTSWVNARTQTSADNITTTLQAEIGDVRAEMRSSLPAKANIASPIFTGTVIVPTISDINDSSNKAATTQFVQQVVQADVSYWQGSRKFVSEDQPTASDGNDGDFWFVIGS